MSDKRAELLNWLHESGYPLELRVGKQLRAAGWVVDHGDWYTDPETGKARELDIRAFTKAAHAREHPVTLAVELAIQCKSSVGKPWVAFTAPHDRLAVVLESQTVADEISGQILRRAFGHGIKRPPLFGAQLVIAHGLVKAHTAGKNSDPTAPYAALQSAVAAARALAANAEAVLREPHVTNARIVVPVVVYDGELYQFYLDGQNRETLEPIDCARASVTYGLLGVVNVLVVKPEAFMKIVGTAAQITEFCARLVPRLVKLKTEVLAALDRGKTNAKRS